MLKNFSLGSKLTGGFLIIAMIALGTGIFGYLQINKLVNADTFLYEKGAVALKEAGVMSACFHRIRVNTQNLVTAKEQAEITKIEGRIKQLRSEFGEAVKILEQALPDDEAKKLFAAFQESRKSFIPVLDKAITLAKEGKDAEANGFLNSEQANKAVRGEIVAIDNMTTYLQKNAKKIAETNLTTGQRTGWTMIGLSFFGAALAFILGFVITRSVTVPVIALSANAKRIAAGDLTSTTDITSNDEVGTLAKSINEMTLQLSDIIGHITESSCLVAAAAVQLQGNTERISVGVKEVEKQTMSLGTASEEMAATSADIARTCHTAAFSSAQANQDARTGVAVVQETIEDMKRIAERVKSSSETVATLGSRSEQIGAIVGTIEDIADQTNLLALNAAIEAARAGEQGRGFAVVADEVRALAERTTKATHEISEMIKAIQSETQSAVTTMEIGVKEVERGMEASRRSEEALESILSSIGEVTSQVDQIATAAEEQTATTQEIASNIHRVTSVLDTSAHSSNDNVTAVAQLTKLAEGLLQRVREFKVAGNDLLILDLAKNDHKMFVNTIRSAVLGASSLKPSDVSTHQTCRFGKWYGTEGQSLCGNLSSFRAIDAPHDRIHSIAREAITALNNGDEHHANHLLAKVEELSDEMVNRLDAIKQEYSVCT